MATSIDRMIEDVLRREGGFVDHPADRGGPTNFGITQETLSRHLGRAATVEDVRRLTQDVAEDIYRKDYYTGPRIDALPERIQPFVFDSAVNHGPRRAIRFVQRVCNAAASAGPRFPAEGGLDVDGICGPKTRRAATEADRVMGDWFLGALVEERRNFYHAIVEADRSQEVFLKGWLNRIAEFDPRDSLDLDGRRAAASARGVT